MEKHERSHHESLPSNSASYLRNGAPFDASAVTHPSVSNNPRGKEDLDMIFKRMRSGDSILSRLPPFLDPNLQFSDDEDEEDDEANKSDHQELFASDRFHASKIAIGEKPKHPYTMMASMPFSQSKQGIPSIFNPIDCKENFRYASRFKRPVLSQMINTFREKGNIMNACSGPVCSLPDERICINDKMYTVLSSLGSGGSCKVYSAFDVEEKTVVAIKHVNLKDTEVTIRRGYEKEIEYLIKLQSSKRIIKLLNYEYRTDELFFVLEKGDIDFAKYLSNETKTNSLSPIMIKFYWSQMLEAVADIHKHGIIHSDLKPANFLLVAGSLKLIDFGIAASVPEDKTSILRDIQVGTLNYMSPEALSQAASASNENMVYKIGVKSDVWSLGCILYNLVYGITPFHYCKTVPQKLYAITNPRHEISFPEVHDKLLLDVLMCCLKRNPKERASILDLLNHPYLAEQEEDASSKPSSCDGIKDILKQMQFLTPKRMSVVTQVVKDLTNKK